MAMGALRRDVIAMVMREVLLLIAAGLAFGIPLAMALSRLVRNQLYGVQPNDPLAICASGLALAAAAAAAGFIPARGASRANPVDTLRSD